MSDFTTSFLGVRATGRLGGGVRTLCSDFKIGYKRRGVCVGVSFRIRIGERDGDLGCVLIRINLPVLTIGEDILEKFIFV